MRVGVLCSAGGSAFAEVAAVATDVEYFLLTDRECGAETHADRLSIPRKRIVEPDRAEFSKKATTAFAEAGPLDFVIMMFIRLVDEPLLSDVTLLNIHPSLLPAFRGMGAVKKARDAGARVFGATLHQATSLMDDGPILAQAAQPLDPSLPLDALETLSFLHKVALFFTAIDLFAHGAVGPEGTRKNVLAGWPVSERLNPSIRTTEYLEGFLRLQRREGVTFLAE